MSPTPEQQARQQIDEALEAAGWVIQDRAKMNLAAATGVAVCEFRMAPGHGFADYLLFVHGKAVGVVEAKPAGYALTNVELQADKYATGLPAGLNPPVDPLPFLYLPGVRLLGYGDHTTQCAHYRPSPSVPGSVSLRSRTPPAARGAFCSPPTNT